MSSSGYSWLQVKTILEYKGFRQIRVYQVDFDDGLVEVLYYQNAKTREIIGFEKSDNIPMTGFLTILRQLKMSKDEFEELSSI
ncbi:MAG: hypothetical protein WA667_14445 [Candidatus Nitrosopolaris sp.]